MYEVPRKVDLKFEELAMMVIRPSAGLYDTDIPTRLFDWIVNMTMMLRSHVEQKQELNTLHMKIALDSYEKLLKDYEAIKGEL